MGLSNVKYCHNLMIKIFYWKNTFGQGLVLFWIITNTFQLLALHLQMNCMN